MREDFRDSGFIYIVAMVRDSGFMYIVAMVQDSGFMYIVAMVRDSGFILLQWFGRAAMIPNLRKSISMDLVQILYNVQCTYYRYMVQVYKSIPSFYFKHHSKRIFII